MAVLGMNVNCATTFKEYKPPLRVYVHNDGLREAYHDQPAEAVRHVRDVYCSESHGQYSWVIALAWGETRTVGTTRRAIDFFGGCDYGEWPGNPSVHLWTTRDGMLHVPRSEKVQLCGDGIIILGEEEKHRRGSATLEDYLATLPRTLSFVPVV